MHIITLIRQPLKFSFFRSSLYSSRVEPETDPSQQNKKPDFDISKIERTLPSQWNISDSIIYNGHMTIDLLYSLQFKIIIDDKKINWKNNDTPSHKKKTIPPAEFIFPNDLVFLLTFCDIFSRQSPMVLPCVMNYHRH